MNGALPAVLDHDDREHHSSELPFIDDVTMHMRIAASAIGNCQSSTATRRRTSYGMAGDMSFRPRRIRMGFIFRL